jgi:predicted Zn-dependent protease
MAAAIFGVIWLVLIISGEHKVSVVSVHREEQLGDLLMENVVLPDPTSTLIEDTIVVNAVKQIEKRLVEHIPDKQFEYDIYVLRSEIVNGFALPGGNMVLTSSLIKFVEKPEEIAVVLAHEMGHVEKRHVIKKMVKELGLTMLFGNNNLIISDVAKTMTSTAYDRKYENQADAFALELLMAAGIHPKIMADFFEKLQKEYPYNNNLELFMTHPDTDSRIQKAENYDPGDDFVEEKIELDWEAVQEALKK